MQLLESLARCSTEQLQRIASFAAVEPSSSRRDLELLIAANLTNPRHLTELLAQLSSEEWAALKVVFFNGGDQGITVELCHQIVNLMAGKRRKTSSQAVEELQRKGLVYTKNLNYRQVFFIPADLLAALTDIVNRHLVSRIYVDSKTPVGNLDTERDLMEDLHRFLCYLVKSEVAMTQQGQIFKRHLRSLSELLLVTVDSEDGAVGRYPEPLGLLVGFALDRNLVSRDDLMLRVTSRLDAWLNRPSQSKRQDLFDYWHERYYYQDLQTFLGVMKSVGAEWVALPALVTELEPMINPSQRGSFLLRLKHHLTTFLAPLRLFELGEADGTTCCRLTPYGLAILSDPDLDISGELASMQFMLLPNFEILVARPIATPVLWQLELIAELTGRSDRTATYRISKQSIYQALKAGKTGSEIVAFLHEHSASGVPQNVEFDLRSWASTYGQVYLQEVCLLRCSSPHIAEQVKVSRRTARFVLGSISPSDLIVSKENYRELLEALEADGLMPRPGIQQLPTVE